MASSNMEGGGGGGSGITFMNLENEVRWEKDAEREKEEEEEEERREEEEEDQRREEEVERMLQEDLKDLVLEEELDSDDENTAGMQNQGTDAMETPVRQGLPANYLATSTPFGRMGGLELEEGALVDTPGRSDGGQNDEEMRYLNTSRSSDQLEILYRARGTEIERLKAELSSARDETGHEARRLRHDLALSKGRCEELRVQLEQETEANQRVTEENAALRADVELLKLALQKQERVKADLVERAEASDHVVQTLQAQLEQLQMSDTALRAREHHDATVRSLKERHEAELHALQRELDSQAAVARRREREVEEASGRLAEVARAHDAAIVEKSERIDVLSSRLAESQRRLADLISANGVIGRNGSHGGGPGGGGGLIEDPVKEICDLKSKLAGVIAQRNDLQKNESDLTDEIAELRSRLKSANEHVAEQSSREEALRSDVERKKREIEELQKRERELLQKHEQIKSDMARVRQQVAGGRTAATGEAEALRKRAEEQEAEIVRKDEQLREQESKIKSLVDKWESEALQIRENHGRDRAELEEARAKYSALKRKVRAAQNHWQKKEEHYKKEISDLREAFGTTLLGYKEKMSEAYQDRERKVEEELVELKRYFDAQLNQISAQAYERPSSDEENSRPSVSSSRSIKNSRDLAKAFADAGREAKGQLKRPPLHNQNTHS